MFGHAVKQLVEYVKIYLLMKEIPLQPRTARAPDVAKWSLSQWSLQSHIYMTELLTK